MNNSFKFLILILAFSASFFSCEKDLLVTDVTHNKEPNLNWGVGSDNPIIKDFYFKGKIDSTFYVLQDNLDGFYNLVFDSTYLECNDTTTFHGQLTGMYTLGLTNTLEVKFLKCIKNPKSKTDKQSLIFIGSYPYGSSATLNQISGVEISWIDENGIAWTSLSGSGANNNDSFVVKAIKQNPGKGLGAHLIIGTMNVDLYNATKSIRIEGGEFSFQYGVY